MWIVFRADASIRIGTGHVMRCLTLADDLRARGARVHFVCRELPGHLIDEVERRHIPVFRLPLGESGREDIDWSVDADETERCLRDFGPPVDWLVVDHYGLDHRWERRLGPLAKRLMVMDDLADRKHCCDLLLDPNFHPHLEERYRHLVPDRCRKLLGPEYVLLRPEFRRAREQLGRRAVREGRVRRVLVFFGGSDPTHETMKALDALERFDPASLEIEVDVVVGQANPMRDLVFRRCEAMERVQYHCQVDYMARLMVEADLSLGAGGATMWERCFLGLPSAAVVVAENQSAAVKAVSDFGAVWNLGWHEDVKTNQIADILNRAVSSPDALRAMSERAVRLMGGDERHAVHSVAQAMTEVQA